MTIISFFCLIIFFVLIITSFLKNADLLSPGRIFGFVWTLTIGLADLKLSWLQINWNLYGWLVLSIGFISLLLGIYISRVLNTGSIFLTTQEIRNRIRSLEINESKLFVFIIIFFLLYVICYFAEYLIEGYVPLFTDQPDKARILFGVFGLHLIVNGVNIILFLIIEYFVLVKGNKSKKSILIFIFIISSLSFFMLLQRYNFFILSMMAICFIYYSGRKIRLRTFVFAIIIVGGFVYLIQSVRLAQVAQFYVYSISEMKFSPSYAIFSEPYMYLTMNLGNFVDNFDKIDKHTYGIFTTDFVTALLGLKSSLHEYFHLDKFPHYIAGYNTFPFFWAYYYDFGFIGLAFFPFLIGFIISEINLYLHHNPNLIRLALYCVGFSIIVISYSSDPLTRLDMIFNYSVIVFAQYFIVKVN